MTGYGLDVDALLEAVPARLLAEWQAAYGLEPWGEERSDLAAGVTIMHLAAAAGAKPKPPAEYMPYLQRRRARAQTEEEIRSAWDAVCRAMRKREESRNKPGDATPEP